MKFNILKKKKNNKCNVVLDKKKAFDTVMQLEHGTTYDEYVKDLTKGMYLFEIQEFKRKLDKELTMKVRKMVYEMVR